jgi:transposase
MIVKRIPYKPPNDYLFSDEKRKLKLVTRIKKQISKFDITNLGLGIVTS